MNNRIKLRNDIIFDECEVLEPAGGIRRFQNLDAGRLKTLIDEHLANVSICQNEGPDIRTFDKFARTNNKGLKRKTFFEGYVYNDVSSEEEISPTIDGIREIVALNDIYEVIRFVTAFHNADEFTINKYDSGIFMRAWWD